MEVIHFRSLGGVAVPAFEHQLVASERERHALNTDNVILFCSNECFVIIK